MEIESKKICRYKVYFGRYTEGMAKYSGDKNLIGTYYIIRLEFRYDWMNEYKMMASTRLWREPAWSKLFTDLSSMYTSIIDIGNQSIKFSDVADEAAFILQNEVNFDTESYE